ncbi:MAG: hypothetical protein ABFD89_23425 [Bryobacteraceae bacterium]
MEIPFPQRIEGLTRWFERRNEHPLIGFTLGSYYPLHRYPNAVREIPSGAVAPADIVVSKFLDDTDELYRLHLEAGGDLIWSAAPFLGVPWLEAALGCGVIADHNSGSIRATPPPWFADRPQIPVFSTANPWVEKLLEFVPALERRSGGRYPVGATLMRGISDLLSALYGGETFVLKMQDDPEEIQGMIDGLTEFWIEFGRAVLDRLPMFCGGTGSYLYSLWCPGKTIWLQEDAVALLSPTLFERYIFPADCRIAEAFEHVAIHLHPTRYIPSELFSRSPIDAIELHIDHVGPRVQALTQHYRTVLKSKPCLIWGELTITDLDFLLSELPAQGLAINIVMGSVEQARRTWKYAMDVRL